METEFKPRSSAVYFDVRITEALRAVQEPVPRVTVVCNLLDEIAEQMGPYHKPLQTLLDELYRFVLCDDEFTTVEDEKGQHSVEKLPYFALLDRFARETRSNEAKFRSENERLRTRLMEHDVASEAMMETVNTLRTELASAQDEIETLASDFADTKVRLKRAEEDRNFIQASSSRTIKQLERELAARDEELKRQQEGFRAMSEYKKEYAAVQKAFSFDDEEIVNNTDLVEGSPLPQILSTLGASKNVDVLKKKSMLAQEAPVMSDETEEYDDRAIDHFDLSQIKKLEGQFLRLRNAVLTDFESAYHGVRQKDTRDRTRIKQAADEIRQSLRADTSEISKELELLDKQKTLIEARLKVEFDARQKELKDTERNESSVLAPLIKSRFAVLASFSKDHGKNFNLIPRGIAPCFSCGDKRTLLCPHRPYDEFVITLPAKVTHIRFFRPQLSRPKEFTSKKSKADLVQDEGVEGGDTKSLHVGPVWTQFFEKGGTVPPVTRDLSRGEVWIILSELYSELEYKEKTNLTGFPAGKQLTDLGLSSRGVLSPNTSIYSIASGDSFTSNTPAQTSSVSKPQSKAILVRDFFYEHMLEKYGWDDLAFPVIHDVLLISHQDQYDDIDIGFFYRLLSGDIHDCAHRYVWYIRNYLHESNTVFQTRLDLEVLARMLYPVQFQSNKEEDHAVFLNDFMAFCGTWETDRPEEVDTSGVLGTAAASRLARIPEPEKKNVNVVEEEEDISGSDSDSDAASEVWQNAPPEDGREDEEGMDRVTAESLCRYFRRAAVLKTEVRFKRMREELKRLDSFYRGWLSFDEFWEVLHTQLLPSVAKEVVRKYFVLGAGGDSDRLGLDDLAWIASYLDIIQHLIPGRKAGIKF